MTGSDEKLGELLLLLAHGISDEPSAGSTKLNKLAYFADFTHVRKTGRPISGAEYQRLPNGPAPRHLLPVHKLLITNGDAEIVKTPYLGFIEDRLVPKRKIKLDMFSAEELETVSEVLDTLGAKNGNELSSLSHSEPGWKVVSDGDEIPYATAFLRNSDAQPSERAREYGRKLMRIRAAK